MGITGLLPFVKDASKQCHLSELRGKTTAIDSYCWLHKGAFGCAEKLAKGEVTTAYISYCFKYIDMLLTFRIKPIMVFDGRHLPAKSLTEKKRREGRDVARKRASEYLRLGKLEEARQNFRKCVDITPEMAFELIKECRKRNIDCIVAPYEADAQLAYLNRNNIADFVISEDSDLLTFGCTNVLFKLDLSGIGTLVQADKLHLAMKERPEIFSLDRFRHMCILSGCDYLESLPGIGLKKALTFLKRESNPNIFDVIAKLPSTLKMQQLTVTQEYREQFMIADATFRHQYVFDPIQRRLVQLTDAKSCGTKSEYCCNAGEKLQDDVAFQIAIGNLNPFNLKVLDNWCPDKALQCRVNASSSIWSKSYKPSARSKIKQYSPQKPVITKGINIEVKVDLQKVENDKKEYDQKLEKELRAMYFSPPSKKRCIRTPSPEVEIKSESLSPVLSGRHNSQNPFITRSKTNILKKISNFNRTVVSKDEVVTSRFFSDQNDCDVEVKTNSQQSHCIQSSVSDLNSQESDCINSHSSVSDINFQESQQLDCINSQSSISNNYSQDSLISNMKDMNVIFESQSSITSLNEEKSQKKKQGENDFEQFSQGTNKVALPKNIAKEINKPKNYIKTQNTCRRPGLSKKFAKEKNQPTLLSMFAFKRKDTI